MMSSAASVESASPDGVVLSNKALRSESVDDCDDGEDQQHHETEDRETSPTRGDHPMTPTTSSSSVPDSEQYRDFYLMGTTEIKLAMGTPPPKRKGPRGGVASAFPVKLHEMLSATMFEGTDHIVSWAVHGRAFTVHQPSIFVEELMPRYFKQSKMTSFQRQLNLYGFMRKTDGTDRGSYYHELFLRGRSDLAKIMVRTRVKGDHSSKRRIMAEPDFYKMPYCPEDPDPRQESVRSSSAVMGRPFYREQPLRSPRAGYTTTSYYPASSYRDEDRGDERSASSTLPVEVTPCPKSSTEYMSGGINLPSSSFFLDEEPPLRAPEDSMWTPPPFPEYRRSPHRPRERPSYPVIQPNAGRGGPYPPVVSPDADHLQSRYSSSSREGNPHGMPSSYRRHHHQHHPTSPSPRIATSTSRDHYARERYSRDHYASPHHPPRSRRHPTSERDDVHHSPHPSYSHRHRAHHPTTPVPSSRSSGHGSGRPDPRWSQDEGVEVIETRDSKPPESRRHHYHHRHHAPPTHAHQSPQRPQQLHHHHRAHRVSVEEASSGSGSRHGASGEGRSNHNFFDDVGFQPVDDTSLEMFESSIDLA